MQGDIRTINYGSVNCYLIRVGEGFLLIDTGLPSKRTKLEQELEAAGCTRGKLRLIVLTHGDYDHAGNAAYLREKYGSKIAIHAGESGKVERADWTWGMKAKPDKFPLAYRFMSFFIRPGQFDKFKPDLYVEDGQSLSEYGYDAQVVFLPGHTMGSVGVLTTDGILFCGDLMDNMRKPGLEFFIDDLAAANSSVRKLDGLKIKTVYPGHGKPFSWQQLLTSWQRREVSDSSA